MLATVGMPEVLKLSLSSRVTNVVLVFMLGREGGSLSVSGIVMNVKEQYSRLLPRASNPKGTNGSVTL